MGPWLTLLLSAVVAWLIGSIPFSLLVARWGGGIDLRQHGSGNVGATNVARTLGPRWGALALGLDVLKGVLPVLLLPWLCPAPTGWQIHQEVVCGVMAVIGHMYPPWLGFRGGKGVATGFGVIIVLAPWEMLCALGVFALVFAVTRIVSLASILGSLTFAVIQVIWWGKRLWEADTWTLGAFSVGVPLLILWRHRGNMARLWTGTERSLDLRKNDQPGSSPPLPSDAAGEDPSPSRS